MRGNGSATDAATDGLVDTTQGESTRRAFLRALAVSGTGAAGLRTATEVAFGDSPTGVPVVWTRDQYGRPDRIRYMSKERHRRLRVYQECRLEAVRGHAHVNSLTLTAQSDDPTDLAFHLSVDHDTWRVRRKLPNRICGVPVTHDEHRRDLQPGQVCEKFSRTLFDPLRGNVEIRACGPRGYAGTGTLGLVCWDTDNVESPSQCLLTAAHVVTYDDGTPAEHLAQSGQTDDGTGQTVTIGTFATHSPLGDRGLDVAKYRLQTDAVTGDPLATQSDAQPNITGTWDFAGLTDATAGANEVPVTFAGRSTCYATATCTHTSKTDSLAYEAVITPCVVSDGDSGGPFIDPDGKLVSTFSLFCDSCGQSRGPVGTELLTGVDAQLSPPHTPSP